jgi:FSR family fosmidomycin resistance protein-like MFS transporter
MFRSISKSYEWYLCILIYNFCAFAMQIPIGVIADKIKKNHIIACIGCLLIICGFGMAAVPLVAAIIIGIGNGMFHIGGGVSVLNACDVKIGALGIFIAPGAFGIYLGALYGSGDSLAITHILIALFVSIVLLATAHVRAYPPYEKKVTANMPAANFRLPPITHNLWIGVFSLCAVVCLRSYFGMAANFPWRGADHMGLALVCASASGKAAGGFLADRFGLTVTSFLSLGISAILFLFPYAPAAAVIAIFFFNMTTPVTLWVTVKIFKTANGFSFGLLTFALFLGFLPVYLGAGAPPFWIHPLISLVSLALIYIGLRKERAPAT